MTKWYIDKYLTHMRLTSSGHSFGETINFIIFNNSKFANIYYNIRNIQKSVYREATRLEIKLYVNEEYNVKLETSTKDK